MYMLHVWLHENECIDAIFYISHTIAGALWHRLPLVSEQWKGSRGERTLCRAEQIEKKARMHVANATNTNERGKKMFGNLIGKR